jgi:hypothetical protein
MRLHLALLPSTMRTAFLLMRFRRHAMGREGRERVVARRTWLRRHGVGFSGVCRLAFQELLERRRWAVAAGLVGAFGFIGSGVGSLVRMLTEAL